MYLTTLGGRNHIRNPYTITSTERHLIFSSSRNFSLLRVTRHLFLPHPIAPSHLFSASPSVSHLLPFILSIHHVCVHLFFHHTPAKLPLLAASSSNSCFLCRFPTALSPYRDQQQPASCSYIAMHSAHNDTASKK